MYLLGIIVGSMAFGVTDAAVSNVMHSWQAGVFPGLIAGAWTAWPFIHFEATRQEQYLHPAPKIYDCNVEDAFTAIHTYLSETAYNYGDKWRVITADPPTMRIVAEITFQDEEIHFDINQRGEMRERKEFAKRYIKFECQMKSEAGRAVIQCDFNRRIEGFNFASCDKIIEQVFGSIATNIGIGQPLKQLPIRALGAPPMPLLIATGIGLLFLAGDALHVMMQ
ncbi:MAG TPA: hypothetical protein V6C97_00160 [Oculatellaceae cyanobacterium]